MGPITAQLCIGSKWMAGTNWIAAGDGLQEMDPIRRWIAARRWITGGGWQSIPFPFMKILRLCEVIPSRNHLLWFQATELQSSADMQIYDVPAAWLHQVRYRALFRTLFRDTELCSYKPEFQCGIRSRIRSRIIATMPIPHNPYEINLWWSNDF